MQRLRTMAGKYLGESKLMEVIKWSEPISEDRLEIVDALKVMGCPIQPLKENSTEKGFSLESGSVKGGILFLVILLGFTLCYIFMRCGNGKRVRGG